MEAGCTKTLFCQFTQLYHPLRMAWAVELVFSPPCHSPRVAFLDCFVQQVVLFLFIPPHSSPSCVTKSKLIDPVMKAIFRGCPGVFDLFSAVPYATSSLTVTPCQSTMSKRISLFRCIAKQLKHPRLIIRPLAGSHHPHGELRHCPRITSLRLFLQGIKSHVAPGLPPRNFSRR